MEKQRYLFHIVWEVPDFVDRIIVLDNGKLVEVGSHNELMKKNG